MTLVFALLFVAAANMQAQTIKVNVKDETGEGIFGATVQEQGTSNGGTTNLDGDMTITLKNANSPIVISYLGMKSQTVKAEGRSVINIVLKDDVTMLNDVGAEVIVPAKDMFLWAGAVCMLALIPLFFLVKKGVDAADQPQAPEAVESPDKAS